MVGLTEKLMEILDIRKETLSGEDIRHIVDSIHISETLIVEVKTDPKAITTDKIIKEWRGE